MFERTEECLQNAREALADGNPAMAKLWLTLAGEANAATIVALEGAALAASRAMNRAATLRQVNGALKVRAPHL